MHFSLTFAAGLVAFAPANPDERLPLEDGEEPEMKMVRFRTLGCYPLTGAIESDADTLPKVIQEMLLAKESERQGRLIDHDSIASMEQKKREGYF